MDKPRLLTIQQFAEENPAFTVGSLRWLRFQQDENGFRGAFVKIGERVLVNEERFFEIALSSERSDHGCR